jgi:Protein of unknown function (DUF2726)
MTTLQIALALVLVVALLAWWRLRRRTDSAGASADEVDRIDTLIGWPPEATRVLSTQERLAFNTLVRALPEYMILAQVPLSRFLNVPKRHSYADWLRRLGYQCADFVVCDMAAQVVAVVEVLPPQSGERARKRLTRMSRSLKAAKIPMLTWIEGALPSVDAARAEILPAPAPAQAPAGVAATVVPAVAVVPAAAAVALKTNPFDDTNRDSTQDEWIELLEPPPSTWFDELDSDVVPLRKN